MLVTCTLVPGEWLDSIGHFVKQYLRFALGSLCPTSAAVLLSVPTAVPLLF